MTAQPETRMVAVDGTDALAYVILRPGSNASGVVIEAAAKGISKAYAAYALRHTAQSWDPDDTVGADVGEQLKEALAEVARLKAELERATDPQADILIDCTTCSQPAHWIDSPTGGWWSHEVHPADGHDAAAVEVDLINEIQLLHAENDQLRADLQRQDGEARFWEFEYREAMDNYWGEVQQGEELRAVVHRLAVAAENGKHSLAAFVSDSSDPGSAALGALYLLQNALAGQPDTEPAFLEVTPERLRAAHFDEAARLVEDAGLDEDAVSLLDDVANGIAAPACSCHAEPVHQAGCDLT